MIQTLMPSFSNELLKIAFVAKRPQDKAEVHFAQEVKDWGAFEKNLKSKGFQKAVVGHPEADAKLKRYVKNFGDYLSSKDVVGKVSSRHDFKHYTIKKLPSGRLACNCKDWQYWHSTRNSDCFHIKDLKAHGMQKTSSSSPVQLAQAFGASFRASKAKNESLKGRIAQENARRRRSGESLIAYHG